MLQSIADKLDRVIALLEPPKPVPMVMMWETDFGSVKLPDNTIEFPRGEIKVGRYTGQDINVAMEKYAVTNKVDTWGSYVDFEELRPYLQ